MTDEGCIGDVGNSDLTGMEMAYAAICPRKLWLFRHGIRPEHEHVNVQLGRHIQRFTFEREEKDIPIGMIGVLDWAHFKHGIIHETKKGKAPMQADRAQVGYYLWWLRRHNVNVRAARIHYPEKRRTVEIEWDKTLAREVEARIESARAVIALVRPPDANRLPYCKSCAYEEVCYA